MTPQPPAVMPPGRPVFMLAVDHRWQWEEWCDGAGIDRRRHP